MKQDSDVLTLHVSTAQINWLDLDRRKVSARSPEAIERSNRQDRLGRLPSLRNPSFTWKSRADGIQRHSAVGEPRKTRNSVQGRRALRLLQLLQVRKRIAG